VNTTRRTPLLALLVVVTIVVTAIACRKRTPDENVYTRGTAGGGTATTPTTTPTTTTPAPASLKVEILKAEADCALGRFKDFEPKARALRDAARAWADDRSAAKRTAAREAWRIAIVSWEEAEVFRIGPAAAETERGGKGLRDQIYPFPLFNRCEVDIRIVNRGYADPSFGISLISARGLGAFEYVAFYEGTDNGCAPGSAINLNGSWAALDLTELTKRKAEYAAAIADVVLARAEALVRAWDPVAENFHRELATAGAGSKTYATDQDAFNALNFAAFYIENEVKDEKLGRPTGLYDCAAMTCPDAVESRWARAGNAHLKANLLGFRRLFEGCGTDGAGPAFDDLLRAVGAGQLADRMLAALANARATADGLTVPFEDLLGSDLARARAVHAAVKATTDLLKVDVVTVLNLELPMGSEGDND